MGAGFVTKIRNRPAKESGLGSSAESVLPPGAITLQDNERDDDDDDEQDRPRDGRRSNSSELYGRDRNRACWARSVQVTDYVRVNGSTTNIGAFVVWNIRVETLNGSRMNIRKRYSEFDDLRKRLVQTFPSFEAAVPALPPKSVLKRFQGKFLEKRRAGLQYFLK
ncbi:PX domain-containing protein ypt35 [Collariella sp. IMI 366227]|nr:PX domain-containing protein ypt35 [Collariella sp. IMI 366227]